VRSPDELTDAFRQRGLKATPQRQAVFRALHGHVGHPTAEAVHALVCDELPTVSLRTVYATLHDLADMGEIGELELGTGSVRFDPNVRPHHHLVCDGCGAVFDIEADFPGVRLPDDHEHGFEVSGAQIVFRGRCPRCQDAADEQHPGSVPVPAVRHQPPDGSDPSRGEHAHG
jgi:Fe2+ or Zn2+ uptake regulation protein